MGRELPGMLGRAGNFPGELGRLAVRKVSNSG
jgi:hypothetical protein